MATTFPDSVPPLLARALERRGFTELTKVQEAVLSADAQDKDLRISSQTGSGKTVAIGFVIAALATPQPRNPAERPKPRALVISPTRELAKQIEDELKWLFADLGARVTSVTGGTNARDEHRALAQGPHVVVGTPGRLIDHMERGALDTSAIGAVVLDEADRMLDMGFREELENILGRLPEGRRTHLVSATFPADVKRLADRVQGANVVNLEGTRLGKANEDIDHTLYLVDYDERFPALVNLLLANPGARTLVFAQMRADVAEIAMELGRAGFGVASISGELEQRERTRALSAFKSGRVRVLVATDVAARGIDVENIELVIQTSPPTDADTYTHRSGRTGRAGKKGKSAILVTLRELAFARRILERAKVKVQLEPVPTRESLEKVADDALVARLSSVDESIKLDERLLHLAERLLAAAPPQQTVARLLASAGSGGEAEARDVRAVTPPAPRTAGARSDYARGPTGRDDYEPRLPGARGRPTRIMRSSAPSEDFPRDEGRFSDRSSAPARDSNEPPRVARGKRKEIAGDFAPFTITWGSIHGADARRLLAMVCRRGGIGSGDVGAIDVGPMSSTIGISRAVADSFGESAGKRDPRDPRVRIFPLGSPPSPEAPIVIEPEIREAPRAPAPRKSSPKAAVSEEAPAPRKSAPRAARSEEAPAPRKSSPRAPSLSFDDAPAPRKSSPRAVAAAAAPEETRVPAPRASERKQAKPAHEKPAHEKPAFEKPRFEKPAYDGAKDRGFKRPSAAPGFDKPKFEKPGHGTPAFEKPKFEKPKFEKPKFEKPKFEKRGASDGPNRGAPPRPGDRPPFRKPGGPGPRGAAKEETIEAPKPHRKRTMVVTTPARPKRK